MPQNFEILEPKSFANSFRHFVTTPAGMICGGLGGLLTVLSIYFSMSGKGTTLGAGGPQPSFSTVSLRTAQACADAASLVPATNKFPNSQLTEEAGAPCGQRELLGLMTCHRTCI